MLENFYDVIIIGGGPAGIFSGIVCARNNLNTLILEKQSYPIDKSCGEGIMPIGVDYLRELGVSDILEKYPYSHLDGIRYISRKGRRVEAYFTEGFGLGIQRKNLSSALLEIVKNTKNLYIQEGISATYNLGENPQVEFNNILLRPKLLIGADGLHSQVRKLSNLETSSSKLKRWGVRQHFKIKPWSKFVEIFWGSGIEAYVTPVSASIVNVSILWDSKRYKPELRGKELFVSLLNEFPKIKEYLENAVVLDKSMAVGPLYQKTRDVVNGKILLIGDAAGFFDPITGEGISLAAKQALLLEKFVLPILKENTEDSKNYFCEYSRKCSQIYRSYSNFTRLVLLLRLWPKLTDRVIQALQICPNLFQNLLSLNKR